MNSSNTQVINDLQGVIEFYANAAGEDTSRSTVILSKRDQLQSILDNLLNLNRLATDAEVKNAYDTIQQVQNSENAAKKRYTLMIYLGIFVIVGAIAYRMIKKRKK